MSKEQLEEELRKLVGQYVHVKVGGGNLCMSVYDKLSYEGNEIYVAGDPATEYVRFPLGSVLEIKRNAIQIAM